MRAVPLLDATPDLLGHLFSPCVVTAWGEPERLQEPLHPAECDAVARAVAKRRTEFTAGRTLARRALERLGAGAAAIPIGEKREPVWPAGITGSISHTRGFCGVALARARDVRGLGFDAERLDAVRPGLAREIVTDTELRAICQTLDCAPSPALALAFSAKESFFKCQYPLTRRWLGLLDAVLTVTATGFTLAPAADAADEAAMHPAWRIGPIVGRIALHDGLVLTAVELPCTPSA